MNESKETSMTHVVILNALLCALVAAGVVGHLFLAIVRDRNSPHRGWGPRRGEGAGGRRARW